MRYEKISEDQLYAVQKGFVLRTISAISFIITLVFGINAFITYKNVSLTLALLVTALISAIVFYLNKKNKLSLAHRIDMMMIPLFFLMLYLAATGGVEGTGAIWLFVLPPVTLFLYGFKRGVTILGLYIFIVFLFYFTPLQSLVSNPYGFKFKLRLLIALTVASSLTAIYAYVTQLLFDKLNIATQKLEQIAETDQLTKVLNRHGALYRLKEHHETKQPFSLLLIDVDHFKAINDKHGHLVGDGVLRNIATLIGSHLRKEDSIARWGGEEFLVLLPDTNKEEAFAVAEKIRHIIRDAVFDDRLEIRLSISIGVAHSSEEKELEALIRLADARLYRAKEEGRDRSEADLCLSDLTQEAI